MQASLDDTQTATNALWKHMKWNIGMLFICTLARPGWSCWLRISITWLLCGSCIGVCSPQTAHIFLWLTPYGKCCVLCVFINTEPVSLTYKDVLTPCQTIWIKINQHSVSPSISFKLCKMWFSTRELVILFNLLWITSAFPALVWSHWGRNGPERWEVFRLPPRVTPGGRHVDINTWGKGNERKWLC